MTSHTVRLLLALARADALVASGVPAPVALQQSARACGVEGLALATSYYEKQSACDAARRALEQPAPAPLERRRRRG